MKCPKCRGQGILMSGFTLESCKLCYGTGKLKRKKITITRLENKSTRRSLLISSIMTLSLLLFPIVNKSLAETNLEKSIKNFKEDLQELKTDIVDLQKDLGTIRKNGLKSKDQIINIRVQLENIVGKIQDLKIQINDIEREARIFFKRLEQKAQKINTTVYYAHVVSQINKKEQTFFRKIQEAKQVIFQAENTVLQAKDLIVTLEIIEELEAADGYIRYSDSIILKARSYIDRLNILIREGERLIVKV